MPDLTDHPRGSAGPCPKGPELNKGNPKTRWVYVFNVTADLCIDTKVTTLKNETRINMLNRSNLKFTH